MKKIAVLAIALSIIVLAFVFKNSFSINISSKNAASPAPLQVQENTEGPVTVSVTPSFGAEFWSFSVSLNTHTVEIVEDMTKVSELIDDQGKSYQPLSWEGDPAGGHHRNGILKFNALSPKPKSAELIIKEVGGVAQRSFKWTF